MVYSMNSVIHVSKSCLPQFCLCVLKIVLCMTWYKMTHVLSSLLIYSFIVEVCYAFNFVHETVCTVFYETVHELFYTFMKSWDQRAVSVLQKKK